jgi:hypothetical protein
VMVNACFCETWSPISSGLTVNIQHMRQTTNALRDFSAWSLAVPLVCHPC